MFTTEPAADDRVGLFHDVTEALEVKIGGVELLLVLELRDGRTRWAIGRTHLWWCWWAGEA